MSTVAHGAWLVQLLRIVPPPLHSALDAWSSRVARRRLEQRRAAAQPRPQETPIDYKVRPWRD